MKKTLISIMCIITTFTVVSCINLAVYAEELNTPQQTNMESTTVQPRTAQPTTTGTEGQQATGTQGQTATNGAQGQAAKVTEEKKNGAEQLVEIKDKAEKKLQDYVDDYGSEPYGLAAYILNLVRIYSIPFCFIGIAIGAVYQCVIGIRKLDERDRGFTMIIGFVTVLVIAQVLPLVFAIVVKGWRG